MKRKLRCPSILLKRERKANDKQAGHEVKKCWYYDPAKTLEDNEKTADQNMKEKQAKIEADKTDMKKENPWEVHKGTVAQLPPEECQSSDKDIFTCICGASRKCNMGAGYSNLYSHVQIEHPNFQKEFAQFRANNNLLLTSM
jgi:hypothetical protein